MKKLVSLLVICTMLFSITAFSTTTATKAAGKTGKITIWAWDPNFNVPVMNSAAAAYKKANPNVEVTVVEMAKADIEQKLSTMLASGTTEGLPDIALVEDYNSQKYLQAYPGSFVDLTGKINHNNFAKYKVSLMTLNKKVYGVPFDSGVAGMFYRTDLLKKAGYTSKDMQNITWDKFIEIGKKVKAKTGKAMLAFDVADGGFSRIMMQSAGQWYFDKNGKINLANNPVVKEAVLTYKKIVDSGIIKKTSGWTEWVTAINKGDVASITSGVWIIGSIKAAKDQSGKWAVAQVPRLNIKSSINASNLGGSSWYVLNKSANKDVAIDFLNKEFAGDKALYQKILVDQGAVGTYLPAQTGAAYAKADKFFGNQKVFTDLSTWMKKIPSVNYGMYTYEADAALVAVLQDVIKGKITITAALKKAETQVKNQIGQ